MPQSKNQKFKILKLVEIIYTQTSYQSPLTIEELHERLEKEGIKCENRTISQDIAALQMAGYIINSRIINRKSAYYTDNLNLSKAEYLMADRSILYAPFLTPKMKKNFKEKFRKAFGSHFELDVDPWPVYIHRGNSLNQKTGSNVDKLLEAICAGKEATFYSFKWGKDTKRYLGNCHTIRPVCMIFYGDEYFVLCEKGNSENYDGEAIVPTDDQLIELFEDYRVSEMYDIDVLDNNSFLKYEVNTEKIESYAKIRFKKYENRKNIVLQCDYSSFVEIGQSRSLARSNKASLPVK